MKQLLKTELWKAVHNPFFFAALMIGTGLAMADSVQIYKMVQEMIPLILDNPLGIINPLGISLFGLWMPIGNLTLGWYIFSLIWPILAATPYSWSFWKEKRDGSFAQIVSRVGRKKYMSAKIIAVFVAGGLVIALPVVLNLLMDAMFCPVQLPTPAYSYYPIFNGYFLSKVFYTHPWIYVGLWCLTTFVLGGITACLPMIIGTIPRFRVLSMLFPFVLYMLIQILVVSMYYSSTTLTEATPQISPLLMINAAPPYANPWWSLLSVMGVLLLLSLGGGYLQVVKNEL